MANRFERVRALAAAKKERADAEKGVGSPGSSSSVSSSAYHSPLSVSPFNSPTPSLSRRSSSLAPDNSPTPTQGNACQVAGATDVPALCLRCVWRRLVTAVALLRPGVQAALSVTLMLGGPALPTCPRA